MDSKEVDKVLRREFWPALRDVGFTVERRTARRWWDHVIDVVNVQSYTGHQAMVHGMTSFSFQVNLGAFPRVLPEPWNARHDKRGRLLPAEYDCAFRGNVFPRMAFPKPKRSLNPFAFRPLPPLTGAWLVSPDGANVLECAVDAREQFLVDGLAWFEQHRTPEQMLERLAGDDAPAAVALRDALRGAG